MSVKESFDVAVVPDLDNQPIMLGAVGAGKPVRWTYSHYNNFLSVYGIHNHLNLTFNLNSKEDIEYKLEVLKDYRDRGLCPADDVSELEERLRTFSDFVIGGSKGNTKAALQDAIHEGKKRKKGEVYYTTDESGQKVKHVAKGSMKVVPESKVKAALNASKYAHTPEADAKRSKTIAKRKEVKALDDAISGSKED